MDIFDLDHVENSSLSTSLDTSPNLLELSSVSGSDHLENLGNPSFSDSLKIQPEVKDILSEDKLENSQALNTSTNIADHVITESLPNLGEKSVFTPQIEENLLALSQNSYNNNFLPPVFEVMKMQHSTSPAGIPNQMEIPGVSVLTSDNPQSSFFRTVKKRLRRLTTNDIPRASLRGNSPSFPSRRKSTGFLNNLLNKRLESSGKLVQTEAYKRSRTLEDLQTALPHLSSTVVKEIDDFSTVVKEVTSELENNTKKNVWFKVIKNEIKLSRKLYKNTNFPKKISSKNVLNISKQVKKIEIKREMRKQIETHLLRHNQDISNQIEIPSLIGFMDSVANLEKVYTIYKHPYLLDVLKDMKIDEVKYSTKTMKNIEILIENCEFIQLGVQIDHLLPTAIRSAVYGHMFQSNNNRNNESVDLNWCVFMPLKKDGKKIIENLNSLRTGGLASNTLPRFNTFTDLKSDFYELRDNGILGNDFRIGLQKTNLTADQKKKFLKQFTIAFEFVIDDSIRVMNFEYGMQSVINQPPSFLLIILDLNIRFQRLNQTLKKIRNGDSKNIIPDSQIICDGLVNAVQHKNTVLELIELIYNENSLTDSASISEKKQLKGRIESDFINLVFLQVSDLINLHGSVFIMDNQLEKMFSEPVIAETPDPQAPSVLTQQEIISKKREFIEKLKDKFSLLPQIVSDLLSTDLVKYLSEIRLHNELFKHHGPKAMYVSPFNILRSDESLNQTEGEEYKTISIQSEIHENYETEDNDTISTDAISENSNSNEN